MCVYQGQTINSFHLYIVYVQSSISYAVYVLKKSYYFFRLFIQCFVCTRDKLLILFIYISYSFFSYISYSFHIILFILFIYISCVVYVRSIAFEYCIYMSFQSFMFIFPGVEYISFFRFSIMETSQHSALPILSPFTEPPSQ